MEYNQISVLYILNKIISLKLFSSNQSIKYTIVAKFQEKSNTEISINFLNFDTSRHMIKIIFFCLRSNIFFIQWQHRAQ